MTVLGPRSNLGASGVGMRTAAMLAVLGLVGGCDPEPAADAGAGSDGGFDDAGVDASTTPTTARVLAINDFHGAIAPDAVRPGAGALAGTIAMLRAGVDDSIVVSAGDLVGASPLESGYWHDEPTIEAMNALGLELNAIGNHELDEGPDELMRLVEGGRCHADGCGPAGTAHAAAVFEMLAANTFTTPADDTLFAPYVVRELAGTRVAFVGLTLERTGRIAPGAAGLRFGDEADTVNALVPEIRSLGVEAIVVLIHEGGTQPAGPNDCLAISGAIVDIVERMDRAIDVVASGHTHAAYVCEVDGRLVSSAGANGNVVTAIDLTFGADGDVVDAVATNVEVPADFAPEPTVGAIVDRWVDAARGVRTRVVGSITGDLRQAPMCHFVGDAMVEGARTVDPTVDVALMNLGGIRSGIGYAATPGGGEDGEVTYGELYDAHPFGNHITIVTLTGADLVAALDEAGATPSREPLCPGGSIRFGWDRATSRTVPGSVTIGGVPVAPDAAYRVAVSDYNYAGGEGYVVFSERGGVPTGAMSVVDAMERFLMARTPYAPDPALRIDFAM